MAAVNVITKSGSNSYHGELFEYFRNNHLDANLFFNNAAGRTIQPYTQNQFGGAVGGPILKNKLLFFSNYEGFRVVQRQQAVRHRAGRESAARRFLQVHSRQGPAARSCRLP